MNVGYAVANMFPDLCAVDRGIIDVTVNGAIERIAREGSDLEETLIFDIPANESRSWPLSSCTDTSRWPRT